MNRELLRDLFGDRKYADLSAIELRKYHREWKARNRARLHEQYVQRRDQTNARRRELFSDPVRAEERRRYMNEWTSRNKHRFASYYRRYRLKAEYGLTPEQYAAILAEQNGCCAICGSSNPGIGQKVFCVDHDHSTDRVRQLLCFGCNMIIGHAADDPERLRRAATYVERHRDGRSSAA